MPLYIHCFIFFLTDEYLTKHSDGVARRTFVHPVDALLRQDLDPFGKIRSRHSFHCTLKSDFFFVILRLELGFSRSEKIGNSAGNLYNNSKVSELYTSSYMAGLTLRVKTG